MENKKLEEVISNLALECNLTSDEVWATYKSMWLFIKEKAEELQLKDTVYSKEEFDSIKTSFSIPYLGKLYCDWYRYQGVKNKYEIIKNLRKNGRKDIEHQEDNTDI
ncbi:MAG: hypothetical protein J6N78_00380 [Clostridia bacterium]|nr:hypothetical protein [Clostridia bacterium]